MSATKRMLEDMRETITAERLTRADMYNIFDYQADDDNLRKFNATISPETERAWSVTAAKVLDDMFEDDIELWIEVVEGLELSADE